MLNLLLKQVFYFIMILNKDLTFIKILLKNERFSIIYMNI